MGVEDGLHHSLIVAEGDRLAIAGEREAPNANIEPCQAGPPLCQSNARNSRPAIRAGRNARLFNRIWVQPFDGFNANDTLVFSLVGKHGRTRDVANSVDARYIGAPEAIHRDASP